MNQSVCVAANLNPHIWESSQDHTLPVWRRDHSWYEHQQQWFDAVIKRDIPSESMWLNMEKGTLDVLGPWHAKVIKPPNSKVSSSLYNYAGPKEIKKKKKIWNMGRGVWCHMAEQTKLPKHFKNKQGALLPLFSNHMLAQHARSSLQVDANRLFVFWPPVCFLKTKTRGPWRDVTVRSLLGLNPRWQSL